MSEYIMKVKVKRKWKKIAGRIDKTCDLNEFRLSEENFSGLAHYKYSSECPFEGDSNRIVLNLMSQACCMETCLRIFPSLDPSICPCNQYYLLQVKAVTDNILENHILKGWNT